MAPNTRKSSIRKRGIGGAIRAGVACAMLGGFLVGFAEKPANADTPGVDSKGVGISNVAFGSLAPIVNESGFVSWSLDGMGTADATGTIRVQKPAGATTRRAFLGSASTGFSERELVNGDVTLDGTGINWDISTPSSISSWNHWAEVTSLVKAKIDAAPPGIINFTVGEVNSAGIDGEVLAVIFDDPNQTTVNTVVLLFGAQKVGGDTFTVQLSDPINLSDPNLALNMSLGISFGYQLDTVVDQFSVVKVNGSQMTTSAGGQDDGQADNGALITVGGIGDSTADPPPLETPVPGPMADRTDDELYSLLPFVHSGDTSISVFSVNPSNDDNIFFAGLFVGDAAAIVGEGIVVGPETATLNVGDTQTAVATVQDASGNPVANQAVTFTVLAGPNKGVTAIATTDASGKATFTYVGTGGAGMDEIDATFVDSTGNTDTSNTALREWVAAVACGDGVVQSTEQCDDGTKNGVCGDACSSTCQLHWCGDGVVDPGEGCDLGCGNGATGSTCSATCTVVSAPPPPPMPPSCALTGVIAGPPKQLQITVQDPSAGIESIQVTEANNATVVLPAFSSGETGALVVVATKVDQTTGAQVALTITGVDGQVTTCDPVVPGEPVSPSEPATPRAGCNVGPASGATGGSGLLATLVGLALFRRRRSAVK
jgi:cysteine-rich repeat protein